MDSNTQNQQNNSDKSQNETEQKQVFQQDDENNDGIFDLREELIMFKDQLKFKFVQKHRKRMIHKYLKSNRETSLEKLEIKSSLFLDDFIQQYVSERKQIKLSELLRFRDLLSIIYNENGSLFYYNYFRNKFSENNIFIDKIVEQIRILALQDNISQEDIDILLILIEIVSDLIQLIKQKDQFINDQIIQQDTIKILLSISLRESEISNNIKTNVIFEIILFYFDLQNLIYTNQTVLLMAKLSESSEIASEYFIEDGIIDTIQAFIQKQEIDMSFFLNYTWFCQSILKWESIRQKHWIKLIFCIKSIVWMLYVGIDKIPIETAYYQQMANHISKSIRYIQDLDLFSDVAMNPKFINKILQILQKNFEIKSEADASLYNIQVRPFYKLFYFIAVKLNQNSQQYANIFKYIETEENLELITSILHNNIIQKYTQKTIQSSFKIAFYLVESSPVIFDSLFIPEYIDKLLDCAEKQHKALDDILPLLQFFMLMANSSQLKYFMENTNAIDVVVNLIPQNFVNSESKHKLIELLQMSLRYGDENLRKDFSTQSDINIVAMHIQKINGDEILQNLLLNNQDSQFNELLTLILQSYFD